VSTRTIRAATLTRELTIAPNSWDEKTRSVEVVLSAGGKVRRSDWWSGDVWDEELLVSPSNLRMQRIELGVSLLDNHGVYGSVRNVLGRFLPGTHRFEGGKLIQRVALTVAAEHEGIVANVRAGIIDKLSIGYRTWKYEVDKSTNPPTRRATDWEIYEGSLVTVNAEAVAASRGAFGQGPTFELYDCEVVDVRGDTMKLNGTDGAGGSSQGTQTPAAPETRAAPAAAATPAAAAAQPAQASAATVPPDALRAAREAEATRQAEIGTLVRQLGLTEQDAVGWRRNTDMPMDAVRSHAATLLQQRSDRTAPTPGGGAQTSGHVDERDKRRAAIEQALILRGSETAAQRNALKAKVDGADDFRGMSLIRLAEEVVRRDNPGVRLLGRDDILQRAFMSTSDFPNILGNVFGKSLRAQYAEEPAIWEGWCRRASLVDFKPVKRIQLSAGPDLQKVVESGAVQTGTFGESAEGYALDTYAVNAQLSRQTIINDDMDAFTRAPSLMAARARAKENDLVVAILTGNPNMADGVPLFHATHANLITPVLALAALGQGRAAMRKQTGQKGEKLEVMAKFLITGADLETTAWQLCNGEIVAVAASSTNPFKGQLTPRVTSRISSAITWFLVANHGQIDTVEIGFLEGTDGPQITQEVNHAVLGVSMQVVHDVAAKAIDWRGMLMSSGTV